LSMTPSIELTFKLVEVTIMLQSYVMTS
jgi:hypothetical protein